jgi:hypothetical protein
MLSTATQPDATHLLGKLHLLFGIIYSRHKDQYIP